MVLLLSRISDDVTVLIIRWLVAYKQEFVRLNTSQDFSSLHFDLMSGVCSFDTIEGQFVRLEEITAFYFNGGQIVIPPITDKHELNSQVTHFLQEELNAMWEAALNVENSQRIFGVSPFIPFKCNKLQVLKVARCCGLMIPDTMIVTTKKQLSHLKVKWGRIITKSIHEGITVDTSDIHISGQRTEEVDWTQINTASEHFSPTLVQPLIEKEYDVRIFYFRDTFHAIAIFSQNNSLSQIDGRTIDAKRPSRMVPYRLPAEIKEKISVLMKMLKLNYASVDMIYTSAGHFYFLEVNPFGQFEFLSRAGNYYLEKNIASYLKS